MGDLGGSQYQAQSLVNQFDQLLIKQEEARVEARQTGPEYFLKVLEISALAEARDTEKLSEAREDILSLEREVERLQSQILSNDQESYEELAEARHQILRLEQENATLQAKEVLSEQLSRTQQQQIVQLEQEVLALQRKSELTEARQQNHQLEELVKKIQLESQAKSKVIDDLQGELLFRKQQEDLDNHNHPIMWGTSSILELSKDISTLTEDCFLGGNTARKGKFLASTPAARILPKKKRMRRSMSLDLQLARTPIIPGLCKKCSSRPRDNRPGEDSPILPWCPHGSDLSDIDLSTAAPTMASAQLLLQHPRGAMKAVAPKHLKKIL